MLEKIETRERFESVQKTERTNTESMERLK